MFSNTMSMTIYDKNSGDSTAVNIWDYGKLMRSDPNCDGLNVLLLCCFGMGKNVRQLFYEKH